MTSAHKDNLNVKNPGMAPRAMPGPVAVPGTVLLPAFGLFYVLLMAYEMTFFMGQMALGFCVTVGLYVLSRQWGTTRPVKVPASGPASVFLGQAVLVTVTGALSVLLVDLSYLISGFTGMKWGLVPAVAVFFILYLLTVADIGFLNGRIWSLLQTPPASRDGKAGPLKAPGALTGTGYLLGVAGFLATVPWAEPFQSAFAAAFVSLGLILGTVVASGLERKHKAVSVAALIGLLALLGGALARSGDIGQYLLKENYYDISLTRGILNGWTAASEYPRVERFRDGYDRIDIVRVPAEELAEDQLLVGFYSAKFRKKPDFPKGFMFFFNGRFMMRSDHEEITSEYLAHVPVMLNGRVPKRVLVFDLGTGLVARELIKYPSVESVTQVCFSPGMARLAVSHPLLNTINDHVLRDPRVRTVVEDGIRFLRGNKLKFNAVYVDMPVPVSFRLGRFYSREFYSLIREHLDDGGYVAFQAPGSGTFSFFDDQDRQAWSPENKWGIYDSTLRAAGFAMVVPFVSALEADQEDAMGSLLDLMGHPDVNKEKADIVRVLTEDKARVAIARDRVLEYVYAHQEGFIMAQEKDGSIRGKYSDAGIGLFVLNESRFKAAFRFMYPFPEKADPRKINTIIRPLLPSYFWRDL